MNNYLHCFGKKNGCTKTFLGLGQYDGHPDGQGVYCGQGTISEMYLIFTSHFPALIMHFYAYIYEGGSIATGKLG